MNPFPIPGHTEDSVDWIPATSENVVARVVLRWAPGVIRVLGYLGPEERALIDREKPELAVCRREAP